MNNSGDEDAEMAGDDENKGNEGDETSERRSTHFSFSLEEGGSTVERKIRFTVDGVWGNYHIPPERDDAGEAEPAKIDLILANEADDPRTVEFDGYIPFPNAQATDPYDCAESYVVDVFVLPVFDADFEQPGDGIPDYKRSEDYWEVTESFDPPQTTKTVTLDPGEEIGGEHVLIAGNDQLQTGTPPCNYSFESTVTVESDEGQFEVDLEFLLTSVFTMP